MQLSGAEPFELPDAFDSKCSRRSSCIKFLWRPSIKTAKAFPGPRSTDSTSNTVGSSTTRLRPSRISDPTWLSPMAAGCVPTLLLREVVDCPIIIYCEYYFANSHRDISYRIDLPPAEPALFFPRCINAPTLATLVDCDAGYSATHWQKAIVPAALSLQDRGPFRRDRDRPLSPWARAAADW